MICLAIVHKKSQDIENKELLQQVFFCVCMCVSVCLVRVVLRAIIHEFTRSV